MACSVKNQPRVWSTPSAMGDEIGGVDLVEVLLVLEGVVDLGVGHGSRVEPHVDQVGFAAHRLALRRDEDDLIDIGAVQVDAVGRVVLLRHVAHAELREGILLHHARGDRLLDLGHELPDRTDALHLRAVLGDPDRQGRAPEARTREVPVVEVLEPLAEASRAGRLGFPVDRAVELDHALLGGRRADEPRVERVVEHGFVRAPAVGVVVDVLLDAEGLRCGLHLHADVDVERLGGLRGLLVVAAVDGELRVVGVLDPAAGIFAVAVDVDALGDEALVELVEQVELAREVDHRAGLAALVDHEERRNARGARHEGVVGTERRGDMDDTRTVLRGDVVAQDHAEGLLRGVVPVAVAIHLDGLDPRQQLLVVHAFEFGTLVFADDLERHELVAWLVGVERETLGLLVEVVVEQRLGQHGGDLLTRVGVVRAHGHVVDLRADAERRVRGQGPRRRGPGQEAGRAPARHFGLRVEDAELPDDGRVLDVAVAARLVQLVRRETRAGGRRVGLDRVALVEQTLVEELLEQPPQRLDVLVVVGDVGVVHVDPVAHLARELLPHARELHDGLAARAVVLLDGDAAADVLLRDAELLLDAQLHGQAVGVPSGLAVHEVAALGLVAAEDVLDRAGHHVVDARHAVGRGGTLVEDERGVSLAGGDAFVEGVVRVPFGEHVGGQTCQVETFILLELHRYVWLLFAGFLTSSKDRKKDWKNCKKQRFRRRPMQNGTPQGACRESRPGRDCCARCLPGNGTVACGAHAGAEVLRDGLFGEGGVARCLQADGAVVRGRASGKAW